MRPFEYILLLVLVIGYCRPVIAHFKPFRWLDFSLLVPIPIAILQCLIEGPRWQLYPAYTLALIFGLVGLAQLRRQKRFHPNRLVKIAGATLGLLAVIISVALPLLFPVFGFPKPTGPYHIGTVTYHWTDTSRQDLFSKNPADKRQLMVQVWYPAKDTSSLAQASYVDDADAISTGLTKESGLPSFTFDHFKYVKTHAIPSAPMATDKATYPVLVYLTGLGGFRQTNTFQIENLVSHGYIVVGVDQPNSSVVVKFPDGHIVYQLPDDEMLPLINQSLSPSKDAPILNGRSLPEGIIPYLAKDATFTLDQLTKLHVAGTNGILRGRLDLGHAGIFGVSLGAMATAEACQKDPRFRACLMMDAAMPADVAESGLQQPSMWLTRPADDMRLENKQVGGWPKKDIQQTLSTMQAVYNKSKPDGGYYVSISGMFHHNFFDIPYWTPIMSLTSQIGPINAQRGFDIVNAYSLNFFDKELEGLSPLLLNGPSQKYPEANFEKN